MEKKDRKAPRTEQEKRDASEANEEMKEEFKGDDTDKADLPPADRVGGIRGNPS